MRQFRFEYSLKNIPIPSRDNYLRNLIEKVESVLKRMRWKAHFILKGEKNQENTNHFGLSSNKTPPTILELKPFEEDVLKLLENIKFRDTKNHFSRKLAFLTADIFASFGVLPLLHLRAYTLQDATVYTCSYLYSGNFIISTVKSRYSHCFNCLKLFNEDRQYPKNGRFWP